MRGRVESIGELGGGCSRRDFVQSIEMVVGQVRGRGAGLRNTRHRGDNGTNVISLDSAGWNGHRLVGAARSEVEAVDARAQVLSVRPHAVQCEHTHAFLSRFRLARHWPDVPSERRNGIVTCRRKFKIQFLLYWPIQLHSQSTI